MTARDEYVRKMHAKLDDMNGEIDKLVARKERIAEAGRQEYQKQMDDLRARRTAALENLQRLRESSESAWEDIKAGTETAWQAIAVAIDAARQRFK